jgi:GT2 family glycosyltransferase
MAEIIATVVIPNYNGGGHLPHLMESLAAQSETRFQITVVDDASSDDSVAYLRRQWPEVRLICNRKNLGFAGSCNAGIREASTAVVVLLNNDTHVDSHWMAEGVKPFDDAEVGSVASLVLLAEPPHLIDTAGDVYSVVGGAVKRGHGQARERAAGLDRDCFSASGASAFYRRSALSEAGLLDERFESYYEDVDLGFRLAWAGYRCCFAPGSICYHHLSSSYHPAGWRYHFNSARNAEVVWWSHLPAMLRLRYGIGHLFFCLLQGANKLRQGCLAAYIAGKWSVWRRLGHIRQKRRHDWLIAKVGGAEISSRLVHRWWRLHWAHWVRRPRGRKEG